MQGSGGGKNTGGTLHTSQDTVTTALTKISASIKCLEMAHFNPVYKKQTQHTLEQGRILEQARIHP